MKLFEAQVPAEGIMKSMNHEDLVMYRVACDCGSPEHDAQFMLELDEEGHDVTLHVYTEVKTAWWRERVKVHYDWRYEFEYFANAVLNRISLAWDVLFKGHFVMESHTLIKRQQAVNLAGALNSSIRQLDKLSDQRKDKWDAEQAAKSKLKEI